MSIFVPDPLLRLDLFETKLKADGARGRASLSRRGEAGEERDAEAILPEWCRRIRGDSQ